MTESKINTLLLDLDGCVFRETPTPSYFTMILSGDVMPPILPGVQEFLADWVHRGNKLIFTTGRSECFREITKQQLAHYGISYDQLIMDAGTGIRIVVNNNESSTDQERAVAVNIKTNHSFIEKLTKYS